MVVGAAGVGRDEERKALHAALRAEGIAATVHITTDIEIALEAAYGKGPGIVLLAGTGSFAIARLADGSLKRQGGYGWQMGDEGSGYALGRSALTAVGRAFDGRGPATGLSAADPGERATRHLQRAGTVVGDGAPDRGRQPGASGAPAGPRRRHGVASGWSSSRPANWWRS